MFASFFTDLGHLMTVSTRLLVKLQQQLGYSNREHRKSTELLVIDFRGRCVGRIAGPVAAVHCAVLLLD